MLQSWLSTALSLGLVLLATAPVQAANPIASQFWTLVGCDDVDLDTIVSNAADLAKAGISAINNILDDAEIGEGDGSPEWYDARNAMLFWGVAPTDVADGKIKFDGAAADILNEVKDKYATIVDALTTGGNYWKSDYNWMFCKPAEQPYPFVRGVYVKDYVNNMPPALQDKLLSEFNLPDFVYYPDAGFATQATDPEHNGLRRIAMYGTDNNICNLAAVNGEQPAAFVFHQPLDTTTTWMALCGPFWSSPATVSPNVPDSADNLNLYKSQASQLLHELMHFRYVEVIDVNDRLADMSKADHFYGVQSCAGLAGLFNGGSSDLAVQNADNYRIFAEASYLQPRRWDINANS